MINFLPYDNIPQLLLTATESSVTFRTEIIVQYRYANATNYFRVYLRTFLIYYSITNV